MSLDILVYFLFGAFLGIVTGIPIGPVNVAVINSAYRHNLRRAIGVGLGGAMADTAYALLGILLMGHLLASTPWLSPILFFVSGLALIGYGVITVRAPSIDPIASPGQRKSTNNEHLIAGVILGVTLIVLNPAALVTWVVIVGSLPIMTEASHWEGTLAGIGVGSGSFLWFSFVAFLADRGKRLLGNKAIWITRIIGVGLIGYGGYLLVRAAQTAKSVF